MLYFACKSALGWENARIGKRADRRVIYPVVTHSTFRIKSLEEIRLVLLFPASSNHIVESYGFISHVHSSKQSINQSNPAY